jgi:hypothetical protein
MASLLERARAAPKLVTQELHAYALGMADETKALVEHVRELGKADRAKEGGAQALVQALAPSAAAARPIPPSCNTGGKVLKTPTTKTLRGKA